MKKINLLHMVYGIKSGGVEQFIINFFGNQELYTNYNLYIAYFGEPEISCLNKLINCGFKPIRIYAKDIKSKTFQKEYRKILKDYQIDIVHSDLNLESGIVLKIAANMGIKCLIAHAHGYPEKSFNPLRLVFRYYKKTLTNKYSTINLSCSNAAGKYAFGDNYKLVYNAIDTTKFRFNPESRNKIRKELGLSNELVIGYVARFAAIKNHEYLIRLFNKMDLPKTNIKVLFIGDGERKLYLEELVKLNNLENNIIFIPPHTNIQDYYNAMDLFLFPSIKEGFGMVAIEAQINGLYCIASTGIPLDTKISENIAYLDFDDEKWIHNINNHLISRTSVDESLINSDLFNIDKQQIVLKNIYEEAYCERGEKK